VVGKRQSASDDDECTDVKHQPPPLSLQTHGFDSIKAIFETQGKACHSLSSMQISSEGLAKEQFAPCPDTPVQRKRGDSPLATTPDKVAKDPVVPDSEAYREQMFEVFKAPDDQDEGHNAPHAAATTMAAGEEQMFVVFKAPANDVQKEQVAPPADAGLPGATVLDAEADHDQLLLFRNKRAEEARFMRTDFLELWVHKHETGQLSTFDQLEVANVYKLELASRQRQSASVDPKFVWAEAESGAESVDGAMFPPIEVAMGRKTKKPKKPG